MRISIFIVILLTELSLIGISGKVIQLIPNSGTIVIPRSLHSGMYFLRGKDVRGKSFFQKIVIED